MSNFIFKGKKNPASNRQLKVAESLKRSLSEVLNSDKAMAFVTGDQTYTISKVDISPDLRNAKVYVIPFGVSDSEEYIKLLNENSRIIRKSLIHKMALKYAPELKFLYDHSFEQAAKVSDLLDNV
jgi:ribosome-binding factor A